MSTTSTPVVVPPLGQTVDVLTFVEWLHREGEFVRAGEPLFVVETDKATLDVEAPASGILHQVSARPGDEVAALSVIGSIRPEDEHEGTKGREGAKGRRSPAEAQGLRPTPGQGTAGGGRVFISPRARRIAAERGVPLEALSGSGPRGAVVAKDVEAYVRDREETRDQRSEVGGRPPASMPLRGVRAVIAERMLQSHTRTAPVTLTTEADATALVALRHDLAADGVAVTYTDLFLLALAKALRQHPQLNASLQEDAITVWERVDIGVAVDTDRGLLAPVLRDVDRKDLAHLAAESKALAERARQGACSPEELRGSTFTLTNLGMFGIDAFTPLINLPECAILGVGRIKTRPAMDGDQVIGRQMVWLSLTFDHRLVDGGPAARFLQAVTRYVEKPHLLLA